MEDDDSWPDPDAELDEDLVSLHQAAPHLFDGLTALQRSVLAARFGVGGPPRSPEEMRASTGLTADELRAAFGSALSQLRQRLS